MVRLVVLVLVLLLGCVGAPELMPSPVAEVTGGVFAVEGSEVVTVRGQILAERIRGESLTVTGESMVWRGCVWSVERSGDTARVTVGLCARSGQPLRAAGVVRFSGGEIRAELTGSLGESSYQATLAGPRASPES